MVLIYKIRGFISRDEEFTRTVLDVLDVFVKTIKEVVVYWLERCCLDYIHHAVFKIFKLIDRWWVLR